MNTATVGRTLNEYQKISPELLELNYQIEDFCIEFWHLLKMSLCPKEQLPALISTAIEDFGAVLAIFMYLPLMESRPTSLRYLNLIENWVVPIQKFTRTQALGATGNTHRKDAHNFQQDVPNTLKTTSGIEC